MNGREIPGYYFDQDKGKYFSIQNAKDHKYSRENVAKLQKKHQLEHRAAENTRRRRRETVSASHQHNLLYRISQREIGECRRSFYTQRAWPSASVSAYHPQPLQVPDTASHFDRDPSSGELYVTLRDVDVQRRRRLYGPTHTDNVTRMTSTVSSLNYLPASGALVVTTYGSDRPPVVYLTDPEKDGPYVGEQFTPRHCNTVWTSAPRPCTTSTTNSFHPVDTELIAVGASKDLKLFSRTPEGGTWNCTTALSTESDVLALAWLSPAIVCLGGRDGKIQIYDSRSQGSSQTLLMHPAPISQIRPADDFTRVIVSGLCNTLMSYDMRMAKTDEVSKTQWRKRKRTRLPFRKSSTCIVRFEHANEDVMDLGLAVHPRLGLVAAADQESRLSLYNMYTGEKMQEFGDENHTRNKRMRCLRFVEDGGEVSLLANWQGGVAMFGW